MGNHLSKYGREQGSLFSSRWGLFIGLGLILLGSGTSCRDSRVEGARELLNAFQAGCSTNSQWLQLAVDHNARLREVVVALKDADRAACENARADLGRIASMSASVDALLTSSEHKAYLLADAQVRELQIALAQSPDTPANASKRAALEPALAEAQVELAVARATDKASQPVSRLATQAQAANQLGNLLGSMLNNTDKLLSCASSNPSTAIQLATNLTAIGGSLISPVVGAAASVVGQLLNAGTEALRAYPYENALWELDSAIMPTALTCGLESLTELYCDAVDYQTLLHAEEDSFQAPQRPQHPLFTGLDILSRRLPILNDWLYKVQNGSDPQRRSTAEEKIRVEFKRTALRTTRLDVTALFNEQRTLFRDTPEVDRPNLLVNLVASLAKRLSGDDGDCRGDSCGSPYSTLSKNRFEYACFVILGLPPAGALPSNFCPERKPTDTLEEYIQKPELLAPLLTGGIERIFATWATQVFPRVDSLVQAEYTAIVIDDPAAVIDLATIDQQDRITPKDALISILRFLEGLAPRYEGEPRYLDDTLLQLQAVLVELERAGGDPKGRLTAISDALRLQIGPHLIQERIRNLIERDLDYHQESGDLPDDLREILRVTDGDLLAQLADQGSLNHRKIEDGVNESRRITEANIEFFRNFFRKSYPRALDELARRAREGRESEIVDPRFRANTQALARLCAQLTLTGDSMPPQCKGVRYSNVYRDPNGQLMQLSIEELAREIKGQPRMTQICAFHRTMRSWRLDEILRKSAASGLLNRPRSTFPKNNLQKNNR